MQSYENAARTFYGFWRINFYKGQNLKKHPEHLLSKIHLGKNTAG